MSRSGAPLFGQKKKNVAAIKPAQLGARPGYFPRETEVPCLIGETQIARVEIDIDLAPIRPIFQLLRQSIYARARANGITAEGPRI